MSADYKERLRRLALHDDHLIRSMLVIPPGHVEASGVDPKSCALVRLGALVALGAPCGSYSGASSGPWRPARPPMRLWTLMAVTPVTGVARVVAAAPEFALALGYDIDAALEAWNGDSAEGLSRDTNTQEAWSDG